MNSINTTSTCYKDTMQTTKFVLIMMIGLAMIEYSMVQSSSAAIPARIAKPAAVSHRAAASPEVTVARDQKQVKGLAAVYGDKFIGRKTASGQRFCQSQLTAAHRSLPLGTKVRVTNVRTSKSVEVSINDRGPFHSRRVIDLSKAAAAQIGMKRAGIAVVRLEVLAPGSTDNS